MEKPLVSIIVITYNSAKYVLETLESAYNQTYQNIELIVSDDCSIDNTVEICHEWMEENKDRFVRTELIVTEKNSGVSSNCNQGVLHAKGEWIKLIAGDDLLSNNCVEVFIAETVRKEANILVCNKTVFNSNDFQTSEIDTILSVNEKFQLEHYLCNTPTIAPFVFIKRDVLEKLDLFDTNYKLLEDVPFFIKYLSSGYCFCLIRQNLVFYRTNVDSISNNCGNELYHQRNKLFSDELMLINKTIIIPKLRFCFLFVNSLNRWSLYKLKNGFIKKTLSKIAKFELAVYMKINFIKHDT